MSLVVGVLDDPSGGWVEGAAILAAVLIVGVVTATNDFSAQVSAAPCAAALALIRKRRERWRPTLGAAAWA